MRCRDSGTEVVEKESAGGVAETSTFSKGKHPAATGDRGKQLSNQKGGTGRRKPGQRSLI